MVASEESEHRKAWWKITVSVQCDIAVIIEREDQCSNQQNCAPVVTCHPKFLVCAFHFPGYLGNGKPAYGRHLFSSVYLFSKF